MIHTEVVANENPQDMLYTIIQQQQEALHRYAERDDASTKAGESSQIDHPITV
jgi:hypothetical protein